MRSVEAAPANGPGALVQFSDLSAKRLLREIKGLGYAGGYTAETGFLRDVRPPKRDRLGRRFETSPGRQVQAGFTEFKVEFTAEPGVVRKIQLLG